MPEHPSIDENEQYSSVLEPGEKFGNLRSLVRMNFPNAQETLKRSGLEKKVAQKDFARAAINVAAEMTRTQIEEGTDPLTQLPNRKGILDGLERESKDQLRENYQSVLAFIDLNGLRAANTLGGHDAGDVLLRKFASVLRNVTRETDIFGRYGGDEFIAVLRKANMKTANTWLERLKSAMNDSGVSASVGLSLLNPNDPEGTIKQADKDMYKVKNAYYKENNLKPREE